MDAHDLKKIMAANIQRFLRQKGKSQTDLATDLDIPEMTVSNWINAKTYPRVDKIQLMADYFNVRRSDLTEQYKEDIENELLFKFRSLDSRGKHTVRTVLDVEFNRCTKPHLEPIAAHNDDMSEEQVELMRKDLERLDKL